MKYIYISFTILAFTLTTYGQKLNNDTIVIKSIKSTWAIQIESGVLIDQRQSKYLESFENNIAQTTVVTISYKNFFINYAIYSFDLTPKKSVVFQEQTFNNKETFNAFNLGFSLGYNYNFNQNWSSDFKIGMCSSSFETNSNNGTKYYKSDVITGTRIGISLNRYFQLKRLNYLVVGLSADYNSINYESASPNLGKSFMSYSFTVGYKGWFRKIVK